MITLILLNKIKPLAKTKHKPRLLILIRSK